MTDLKLISGSARRRLPPPRKTRLKIIATGLDRAVNFNKLSSPEVARTLAQKTPTHE